MLVQGLTDKMTKQVGEMLANANEKVLCEFGKSAVRERDVYRGCVANGAAAAHMHIRVARSLRCKSRSSR